jgi:ferric iron reductase protein FhuF
MPDDSSINNNTSAGPVPTLHRKVKRDRGKNLTLSDRTLAKNTISMFAKWYLQLATERLDFRVPMIWHGES